MKTASFLTIVLLFFAFQGFSQEDESDDSFVLSGKIINAENNEGISFAHVGLGDSYWGVICDSLGFFHIRVYPEQKLKISALGFKEQVTDIVLPVNGEKEVFQEIYMDRESYLLQEVDVYSLGTWAEFSKKFVKMDTPKDKDASVAMNFGDFTMDEYKGRAMRRQGFGLSLGFGKKKAKGINLPSELDLINEQLLNEKYNRQLVADLTNESGKRLDILMKYINAKTNFTAQTRDYYIVTKIKQLHKEFLQENPDWDLNFTFTDSVEHVPNHLRP